MVILESWPPVRCLEKGLESAGQVHESVAHQEEHGEKRGDLVDVTYRFKKYVKGPPMVYLCNNSYGIPMGMYQCSQNIR